MTHRVPSPADFANNPMAFAKMFWPDVRFYPKVVITYEFLGQDIGGAKQ